MIDALMVLIIEKRIFCLHTMKSFLRSISIASKVVDNTSTLFQVLTGQYPTGNVDPSKPANTSWYTRLAREGMDSSANIILASVDTSLFME